MPMRISLTGIAIGLVPVLAGMIGYEAFGASPAPAGPPGLGEELWRWQPVLHAVEGVQTPAEELDFVYPLGGAYSGGGGPLFLSALLPLEDLERSLQGLVDLKGDVVWGGRSLFFLKGGEGFGGVDFRVGGFGAGGWWTYAASMGASEIEEVSISLGLGGLLLEKLLAETAQGGVSFGAILGGGSWELQLRGPVQGDFASLVQNPPRQLKLERPFWFVLPYLSVEWKVFPFAGVRLKAGYGLALSFEEWKHDGDPVPGGPLRSVGFPAVELMLIFGG